MTCYNQRPSTSRPQIPHVNGLFTRKGTFPFRGVGMVRRTARRRLTMIELLFDRFDRLTAGGLRVVRKRFTILELLAVLVILLILLSLLIPALSQAKRKAMNMLCLGNIRQQLIGLNVYDRDGRHYGQVVDIIETGSNDVYVVRSGEKEILIPMIDWVVKTIDIEEKKLIFENVEGLIEDSTV